MWQNQMAFIPNCWRQGSSGGRLGSCFPQDLVTPVSGNSCEKRETRPGLSGDPWVDSWGEVLLTSLLLPGRGGWEAVRRFLTWRLVKFPESPHPSLGRGTAPQSPLLFIFLPPAPGLCCALATKVHFIRRRAKVLLPQVTCSP